MDGTVINGMEFHVSMDGSLWTWDEKRGQRIIPYHDAMMITERHPEIQALLVPGRKRSSTLDDNLKNDWYRPRPEQRRRES